MKENIFSRTELLIGTENIKKLNNAKVIVYGIGGVGSFVVEGLERAGVGKLVLVDNDVVSISNVNRQIHANMTTIGRLKTEVMKERILQINPDLQVETHQVKDLEESEELLIDNSFDYVVDSVDTVTTKLKLISRAKEVNVPIISCMGTGNKLDPTRFEIADISKTSVCPLAKVMRKELKNRGIKNVKVLYSKEEPRKIEFAEGVERVPASISFVPSVAGMIIAGEVIKDIIKTK